MALNLLKSQIIPLVEKFEPELQSILVKTLQSVKASNPSEAELFYTNWKLLDAAIEQELGPAPMSGGEVDSVEPVVPEVPASIPEPSPPIIEPTGPTGPVLSEEPSIQETGPTGPTIIQRITDFFGSETGATGPTGGSVRKLFAPNGGSYKAGKRRHGKTAKQHKKRTHRVKHRKH
jgi:hypothetical protein